MSGRAKFDKRLAREARKRENSLDYDSCRICRGEATPQEPLFYPCKCSGSIKYVHQDCLMEWLSHSQKKHCELCKTPFRFTKLYSPTMPRQVPFAVFAQHLVRYFFRRALVWLRIGLVGIVWVAALPIFTRWAWSFFFWVSEEGLVAPNRVSSGSSGAVSAAGNNATGTSPAVAPRATDLNGTALSSSVLSIAGSTFLHMIGVYEPSEPETATSATASRSSTRFAGTVPPSWLSEVPFLNNLTRFRTVNYLAIYALEGLFITFLVVICFILIILVRDYVVQHQPDPHIRAAFEDVDADNLQRAAAHDDDNASEAGNSEDSRTESRPSNWDDALGDSDWETDDSVDGMGDGPIRLPAIDGNAHTEATSNDRNELLPPEGGASVYEYMRIYRRADGDPDRILEIAREEGQEEHLQYWLRVMQNVAERHQSDRGSIGTTSSTTTADLDEPQAFADPDTDEARPAMAPPSGVAESSSAFGGFEYGLRPRANTDGPIAPFGSNPLGSNNWEFPPLPLTPVLDAQIDQPVDRNTDSTQGSGSSHISRSESTSELQNRTPDSPSTGTPEEPVAETVSLETPEQAQEQEEVQRQEEVVPAPTEAANRLPEVRPRRQQPAPEGILGIAADFMWQGLDNIDPADLPPLPAMEEEDEHGLFEPFEDIGPIPEGREALDAAIAAEQAMEEVEALEDAEDLEGVLELLGMRGPLFALFQNVMFCAFLVTVSLLIGIFLPYNVGRISIWLLAHPMHPVMLLFSLSKIIQDGAAAIFGVAAFSTVFVLQGPALALESLGYATPANFIFSSMETTWKILATATVRVGENFSLDALITPTGEIRNFSAISHEALFTLKAQLADAIAAIGHGIYMVYTGQVLTLASEGFKMANASATVAWSLVAALPAVLSDPSSWVIKMDPVQPSSVNPEFAYWGGYDRFLAIMIGYSTVFIVAWWYLKRGSPFSSGQPGQEWEMALIDALTQASGVLKVTFIIGIEMLVFPLYCGLLLDLALMPLFEDTTIMSRVMFTAEYPLTAIFVHWFVGTAYMFHFALFVSMCRKIIRKGVLYFIRDPDDPEFHPVRDVLDRSVTSQLRKIMFSAFVYGALIIVCLGGVVWTLSYAATGALPIHHSSNEPVLEFPIDLLFYNFAMPLAIKYFKPGDGLHAMYTWWFRKSAHFLRLTWFMFGERRVDEEGVLVLNGESPFQNYPWIVRQFLVYDSGSKTVHPAITQPPDTGSQIDSLSVLFGPVNIVEDSVTAQSRKTDLVDSKQLIPDGKFVRAPATDQVKIPKGNVFVRVNENNERLDANATSQDVYNSEQYHMVYLPPNFRARIFLFIGSIWTFAAITGVVLTIGPLMLGRALFIYVLPKGVRTNDIYAFSIGMYCMCVVGYVLSHAGSTVRAILSIVSQSFSPVLTALSPGNVKVLVKALKRIATVVYSYFFILGVCPAVAAGLIELYVQIPLHTYMYPPAPVSAAHATGNSGHAGNDPSRHTVSVVQSWVLGLLFMKLAARSIGRMYPDSRLASSIRAVLRHGSLNPDAGMLTRAFIVPGFFLAIAAVGLPVLVANMLMAFSNVESLDVLPLLLSSPRDPRVVYRFCYPLTAVLVTALYWLWGMVDVYTTWRSRIRDEVYLIGERLQNLGTPPPLTAPAARSGTAAGAR
ncbi:ring finger membrane protein [Ophiostoma piceae UAMH 11346]|uniref:RING-type E3 ubiquitin transferase n=1 Tax=Ophiostoma piceae (strain UAMH 11346) TaxID=1262450 RepID=S3C184_OPHP1|nr:ring finger membrane protein [Ophiostoma piceae UAMH 11346]